MTYNDYDGVPAALRCHLTIVLSISIAVLDGAIANVALPTIARELHASPAASIWVVNAYQLAIIVSLLSFASLGDIAKRLKNDDILLLLFVCYYSQST